MQKAEPDPGATTTHETEFFGRLITFVNAFAANDPRATEEAWQKALLECPFATSRIAIVNCRADRPDRSVQLARACAEWPQPDHYVLIGTGTNAFARAARRAGLDLRRVEAAEHLNPAELFELIVDLAESQTVVVGMGNIGDQGLDIIRYIRNRSLPSSTAATERAVSIASHRRASEFGRMSGSSISAGLSPAVKNNGDPHPVALLKSVNGNGYHKSNGSGNGKHES